MIIDVFYKNGGMSRQTLTTPEIQVCLNDDLGATTTRSASPRCIEKINENAAGDLVYSRTFSKENRSQVDDYAIYNVKNLVILSRDELETVDYIDVDGARLFLPALSD